jgi:ubiquinone/menaquinone biosynthesis C-methylase UbiE
LLSDTLALPLTDSQATFALLANVLHEAEDMMTMLSEAGRVLKPGGRLAIIEWEKREMPMGPPVEHRLHQDELMRMVTDAGFKMAKITPAGDYHIACSAVKRS